MTRPDDEMAGWAPEAETARPSAGWLFAEVVGTLVAGWAIGVGAIWAGCLLAGACQ